MYRLCYLTFMSAELAQRCIDFYLNYREKTVVLEEFGVSRLVHIVRCESKNQIQCWQYCSDENDHGPTAPATSN